MSEKRPALSRLTSAKEFRRWYWLKEELVTFARKKGIPVSGRKPDLEKRLAHWLETGEVLQATQPRAQSDFDWQRSTLTLETVITDSYRSNRNVREFMKTHANPKFAFSNEFMNWMRANCGKTLGDAVEFWRELDRKKREDGYRERSLPQNQYAQFSRALSKAKPGISAAEIRRIWAVKRSGPGPHRYRAGDENL